MEGWDGRSVSASHHDCRGINNWKTAGFDAPHPPCGADHAPCSDNCPKFSSVMVSSLMPITEFPVMREPPEADVVIIRKFRGRLT